MTEINKFTFQEIVDKKATEGEIGAVSRMVAEKVVEAYKAGQITVAKPTENELSNKEKEDLDAIGNHYLYALSIKVNPKDDSDFWNTLAFNLLRTGITSPVDFDKLQLAIAYELGKSLPIGDDFSVVSTYRKLDDEESEYFPATGVDPQALAGNHTSGITANVTLIREGDKAGYEEALSSIGASYGVF